MFDSQIDQIRYSNGRFKLKNHKFIHLYGDDVTSFLHNFFTTDIQSQEVNTFHISTRLNIRAQLELYAYVLKREKDFIAIVPKNRSTHFVEQIEKYLISEDVEHQAYETQNAYLYFDPTDSLSKKCFKGIFLGEKTKLVFQDEPYPGFEKIQPYALKTFSYLTGWPLGDEEPQTAIINNLYLNEIAVDYNKGCFLGQETAAKIQNNRGGASFPVLLEVQADSINAQPGDEIIHQEKSIGKCRSVFIEKELFFICADLKRDWLIEGHLLDVEINNEQVSIKVHTYPYFKGFSNEEKSKELLESGLEYFQEDDLENSKALINQAIKLNPKSADAYESLGVILGREGKFKEAISLMDKLMEVDETSVMAHTNKSLYLMKLGKIDEAEEEKALATVKSFERLGREAKEKKKTEEEEKKKKEELISRSNMFSEVLELDQDDEFANIQLASVKLQLGELEYIKDKFEFLREKFSQNPETYLILVKFLNLSGERSSEKKDLLEQGIELAAKKGNKKVLSDLNQLR